MAFGSRVYGLGAIVLGMAGLAFADFALQWQPVPPGLPARTFLACASAAVLILGGGALFLRRWARIGAAVVGGFYGLWVVALHGPLVLAAPGSVARWLGVAEIGSLAVAGLVLWARSGGVEKAQAATVTRLGRYLFGLCLLVFGLSHFVYAKFTAAMTPAWLPPGAMFWAIATGVFHVAAGLAFLSGVMTRLAARLLTAMFALFAVLVHAPLVMADPSKHLNWLGLCVTLALTGAAWVMADEV